MESSLDLSAIKKKKYEKKAKQQRRIFSVFAIDRWRVKRDERYRRLHRATNAIGVVLSKMWWVRLRNHFGG